MEIKTAVVIKDSGMFVLIAYTPFVDNSFAEGKVEITAVRDGMIWHHDVYNTDIHGFNAAVRSQEKSA